MNWDELKDVWERQPLPEWKVPNLAALEREFTAKQRKLARTLFWRDLREAAAGIFVAAVFTYTGWQMGPNGWPIVFAVLLILGLSGFFVRERIRARRAQLGLDVALLMRLDAEIVEQRRQHYLLSHVSGWYLAPILGAGAVFGATVLMRAPVPLVARFAAGVAMIAILTACGVATIWLNRRAAQRLIEPQLRELEAWRQILSSSE